MFIHPEAKPLLAKLKAKGKLTGHETGRLLILNVIEYKKGKEPFLNVKRVGEIVDKLGGEQAENYRKYLDAFDALEHERHKLTMVLDYGVLACQAILNFTEDMLFANKDYPKCDYPKYGLDTMDNDTFNQDYKFFIAVQNLIEQCEITRIIFELGGLVMKTPGMEKIIDHDTKPFFEQVAKYNKLAAQARAELDPKVIQEDARYLMLQTTNPFFSLITLSQDELEKFRRRIKLKDFKNGIEYAKDVIEGIARDERLERMEQFKKENMPDE